MDIVNGSNKKNQICISKNYLTLPKIAMLVQCSSKKENSSNKKINENMTL